MILAIFYGKQSTPIEKIQNKKPREEMTEVLMLFQDIASYT